MAAVPVAMALSLQVGQGSHTAAVANRTALKGA